MTRRHEQVLAALTDCVWARSVAIDSDPELAALTMVVQFDRKGDVKMVLYRTESRVEGVRSGVRLPRATDPRDDLAGGIDR